MKLVTNAWTKLKASVYRRVSMRAEHMQHADFVKEKLADAEALLNHAVKTGLEVDTAVAAAFRDILEAQAAAKAGSVFDPAAIAKLLAANAALSGKLKPVTAECLRLCADDRRARKAIRGYRPVAVIVTVLVIFYSGATFITSSLSKNIRANLDTANPLAVKLMSELGPGHSSNTLLCDDRAKPLPSAQEPKGDQEKSPATSIKNPALGQKDTKAPTVSVESSEPPAGINKRDVTQDLQSFAMAIRDMYGNARHLSRILHYIAYFGLRGNEKYPLNLPNLTSAQKTEVLELPPGLPNLVEAATERVCVYQQVRWFAQRNAEREAVFSGALTTCILPVLYALLGACAYLLRRFEQELKAHSLTLLNSHGAHFVTAAIAGVVVGLFNFDKQASVSPLAIAFLAGYAVDVFFAFLEGIMQTLSRVRDSGASSSGPPKN